ncbi:MAG: endoglucanase [Phenylobacterium zucineum]|nr:MAG: endoglucanase [Phenylobacterium zucineum]
MRLRRALHSSVAAITIAAVAAPVGAVAPIVRPTPRGVLEVHVGLAKDFTRIEFRGVQAKIAREGQVLTLRFNRDANPDISRLRVSPPPWLKAAEARHTGGVLELVLTLTDDADAKVGTADGATYVNLARKPTPEPVAPVLPGPNQLAAIEDVPETLPPRADPVPPGGVVHMDAKLQNGQLKLSFPWANPNGAAVFRRGTAIWVVFDAPADIDVSRAPRGLKQLSSVQAFKGPDYSAVRITTSSATLFYAGAQGSVWTIGLGSEAQAAGPQVRIVRDDTGGPAALKAALAGTTRAVRVLDPVVGDELSVVTALGPAKGVAARREFVQMTVLPSAQGIAMESYVADLSVTHDGDLVHIGRQAGLVLSPISAKASVAPEKETAALGPPEAAARPGLIDENWTRTGPDGFMPRYNALLNAAMVETQKGKEAPTAARYALARFLIGNELSYEAIGVLNDAARSNAQLTEEPEFRALRGIAKIMARRFKEAQVDLGVPILSDEPAAALWRAYASAQLAQWNDTRTQFASGADAFAQFSPKWKARFARADAQAALEMGEIEAAGRSVRLALSDKTDPLEELATRLVEARFVEMSGRPDLALRIYNAIAAAPTEALSAPALLHVTRIRMAMGKITPVQAAEVFDGLRYRWRGDSTELEAIRALGQLYLNQGRYREALEALRSAGNRLPDLPTARQLKTDLSAAFKSLFLDGAADGLEPIQALALFMDFKELTPLGPDGDFMVRRQVRRLVDVDLLDQAAELLKYQAENRLDGVPRAQVATDLAVIYLMDKKPEAALDAINTSRTTILPTGLNSQRRLVEGRALMNLGRIDAGLELLERDTSSEAQDLRNEMVWKQKNWPAAGFNFEKSLGDRYKRPEALSSDDEGKVLRAGVAYSLAGDDASLARLRGRYQSFVEQSHNPDAMKVALSGISEGQLSVVDFGRIAADNEAFTGWVEK